MIKYFSLAWLSLLLSKCTCNQNAIMTFSILIPYNCTETTYIQRWNLIEAYKDKLLSGEEKTWKTNVANSTENCGKFQQK